MTYRQTLDYLFQQLPMFHRIGAAAYRADLNNTLSICSLLGNPESKFRSLHIAGTNGKGSTSHYLASILQEANYKTGLFTSPHLKDFRERIRVNGKMIPKSFVTEFVSKHRREFEKIKPSFFEWTFGLASRYFALQEIDIAIIETGLGGRLDSTNVIQPELSIITNIGFDHMQFLGDSLEKIAIEKAGIIKRNVPVVIGETQPMLSELFIACADRNRSAISFADQEWIIRNHLITTGRQPLLKACLDDLSGGRTITVLSPLTGGYQLKNLITVLQSVKQLGSAGFSISDEQCKRGIRNVIRNTSLLGRWQVLAQKPLTIADIGHNKDGIAEIVRQIGNTRFYRLHFVLGVVHDKDIAAMLEQLPSGATYYFCRADIPRGLDAEELMRIASGFGLKGNVFASVKEAYSAARMAANEADLIFIGGSAFVVAEVL
jgi:dihydrofolate synthase / folylpolyglutamate synthase